jgi:hypothetical protein
VDISLEYTLPLLYHKGRYDRPIQYPAMTTDLTPIPRRELGRAGLARLPKTITGAGGNASGRFIEFFTANIRSKNTRAAYARAVTRFFDCATPAT